jgi:hypothetical protein
VGSDAASEATVSGTAIVSAPDAAVDQAAPAVIVSAPGSLTDAAALPGPEDAWVANCMERAAELHCGSLQFCRETIAPLRAAQFCKLQVTTFMACVTKTKRSGWRCDEAGNTELLESACPGERAGLQACLFQSGGRM